MCGSGFQEGIQQQAKEKAQMIGMSLILSAGPTPQLTTGSVYDCNLFTTSSGSLSERKVVGSNAFHGQCPFFKGETHFVDNAPFFKAATHFMDNAPFFKPAQWIKTLTVSKLAGWVWKTG